MQQNLPSGFPTKQVSNQSPQLQELARKLKFTCVTFPKANREGADQTAWMLFANHRRQVFSRRGPLNIFKPEIQLSIAHTMMQ